MAAFFDRRMAPVKLGRFAKIPAAANSETRDLNFGAGARAFRTNSGFGIVFRTGELLKSMTAAAADVVEQRHPISSLVLLLKARKLRV
jgi:hypothetical protein